MGTRVLLKPSEKDFTAHISEAFTIMAGFPNDVIIVSAENEQIKANRLLLSLHSSTMACILSSSTSSTIILLDCSAKSLKILISIITKGFTTNECSSFDINDILEVVDTGRILGIKVKNLKPNFFSGGSDDKYKVKKEKCHEDVNDQAKVIDNATDKSDLNDKVNMDVFSQKDYVNETALVLADDNNKTIHNDKTNEIDFQKEFDKIRYSIINFTEETDKAIAAEDISDSKILVNKTDIKHGKSRKKNYHTNATFVDDKMEEDGDKYVDTDPTNLKSNHDNTKKIIVDCQMCDRHFNLKTGSANIFSLQYHYAIHHFKEDLSADLLNGEKCILCDKTFSRWDNALVHVGRFHNKLDILLSNRGLKKLKKSKLSAGGKLSTNNESENHIESEGDKPASEDNGNIDSQEVFKHHTNGTKIISEDPYNVDKNLNNTPKKDLQESLNFDLIDPKVTNDENIGQRESINNGIECQICNKHFSRLNKLEYHYSMVHFKEDILMLTDFIDEKKCIPCDKIFTRKYLAIMHVGTYHEKIDLFLFNKGLKKSTKKSNKKYEKDISNKKNKGIFSKQHIALLTAEFKKCDILSTSQCNSLAKKTGLKTKQIKNLFKIKKDMRGQKSTDISNIESGSFIRKRGKFSKEQISLLMAEFENSEKLNKLSCASLVNSTGLKTKQIRLWFKLQRMKRKKKLAATSKLVEPLETFTESNYNEQPKSMLKTDKPEIGDTKNKRYSNQQIAALTAEFEKSETLNESTCAVLASSTGLRNKQIKKWFFKKKCILNKKRGKGRIYRVKSKHNKEENF